MRSFWIRIFATFWVIEILTIAAVVTLRGSFEDFTLRPMSEKALSAMAFSAEEAYQAGQCNELNPLFDRFERVYKVRPYLFDERGHTRFVVRQFRLRCRAPQWNLNSLARYTVFRSCAMSLM